MKRHVSGIVLAAAVIFGPSRAALAHEFRPRLLEIQELGAGRYTFSWAAGAPSEGAAAPAPVFPAHCRAVDEGLGAASPLLDCGVAGLAGLTIAIEGLGRAQVDAVVRYTAADGTVTTQALREGASTFTVPGGSGAPQSRSALASSYLRAGVEHILRGWDHLFFVFGLLLLVERLGPLVRTITAFTLAHSLTLALAVTGAVHVPQAPAEALIALSLMLLAAELARPPEAEPIARRSPWSMVFVFGLLHGFGFAGALRELGLPPGEAPLALFAFNVGVECGQVAFILAALGIAWIARRGALENDERGLAPRYLKRAAAYAIGAVSAFWFFERLAKLGS